MKEKLSWDTMKNGSIQMIQERTNGTRKMDQAMKRKRIFFTQGIEDKHVEIGKEENIHKPKDSVHTQMRTGRPCAPRS